MSKLINNPNGWINVKLGIESYGFKVSRLPGRKGEWRYHIYENNIATYHASLQEMRGFLAGLKAHESIQYQ